MTERHHTARSEPDPEDQLQSHEAWADASLLIEGCLPGKELLERRLLLRIHEALADIAGLLLEPVRLVGVQ